jgi:hypothetical protein
LGPQAIENTKKKRERDNKSLIFFGKCNKYGLIVAAFPLYLRETSAKHLDDLATPNNALCRKAGKEKVFAIFLLFMVSPAIGGVEPSWIFIC